MKASMKSLLRVIGMLVAMVGVTGGGMMAGALFTSPIATRLPWLRPAIIAAAVVAAAVTLVLWLKPATAAGSATVASTAKPATKPAAKAAQKSAPAFTMPVLSLPSLSLPSLSLGGKADRSPRTVHAMAAAGTAPAEISWRTGMPLDAVSLLLAISSASRQLQPPTA